MDSALPAGTPRSPRHAARSYALGALLASCLLWLSNAEAQIQRVNLAKYQTTASDSAAPGKPAYMATDGVVGNTNSWMSSGAGPHWLQISFPVPMQIGSAQLYLGSDDTSPAANFSLQYFNLSSNAWVTIPGASFSGNTATVLNVVFTSPVTGPMFRFYCTDATVTVREIALFATNGPSGYTIGSDVSLNLGKQCTVIASSMTGSNYASGAVDGYAGTNAGWQTANVNGPHTLEVDFPVASRIGSAHLYSGSGTYPAVSSFTLNYWTGNAWAAIPGATITGNAQQDLVIAFTSPVSTTKVQLSIPGNGTQFVRELAVFSAGTGITGYPLWTDVVSEDPPATQWETYGDGFYSLVNQSNSAALVVSATGATQAAPNATNTAQQFQVLYNLDSDTFRLRHHSSWRCIAAQDAGNTAGTPVVEEPVYYAMPHELWRFQTLGGGYYRVVNVGSGLALQTDGQSPATVTLANVSSDPRQQWQINFQTNYPKKGIAGNEENWGLFGTSWDYNWSLNPSQPPPAQVAFLPQQWNGSGVTTLSQSFSAWHTDPEPMALLGFNEPDSTEQANMTTTNCVALWPQLQAANVPLVAPATTWPLDAWITNFWTLANSAGLRIDESGFHWYSYPSADTIIGNVQSVYSTWGRPVWITEFSTSNPGTYYTEEMNYTFLAEFLWRAEGLACLHRYGIFCFDENEPTDTWDETSPDGAVFLADGITLTPYGQLYAAWDADLTIHTNIPYILHNKGACYRISNTGAAAPGIANIRTNDLTVQWQLVPAPTPNQFYIVSLSDERSLSYSGTTLSLAAAGTTGPAVQWTYTANSNGYFFIDNPGANMRLGLNRVNNGSGQPTTTNLQMYAAGTVSDNTRWRFIKPWKAVPIGLTAVSGNGQAVLSWNPVAGATGYNLMRANVSGGPYTTVASGITTTNYTNTGLTNNTVYYYAVSAVLSTGQSANSVEAAVMGGGVAVNCGSTAAAAWFGPDANYSGGSTSSTGSAIDVAFVTNPAPQAVYQNNRYGSMTYTFGGLAANNYYWVRLHFAESYWTATGKRVFNVALNGTTTLPSFDIFAAAGAENRAVIRDLYKQASSSGQMTIQFTSITDNPQINGIEILQPSPLVPTALTAVAGNGQVTLIWPACDGATSYNVYRATTSGGPYTLISTTGSVTETAYLDSFVANSTTYYYVVTGINPYGESAYSPQAAATPLCAPLAAPTAANNGPIFAGMNLNLTASTVPGASYAWTGPNGFSSSTQNPSITSAATNAAGLYSVTASAGGCSSPAAMTTVIVNPPVALSAQSSANAFVLAWPGGTLQSATNVLGPWTNVSPASSPYTNAPTGPQQFFRVKVQ
jgi:hypothetical protein